jgi:hypothetical protein
MAITTIGAAMLLRLNVQSTPMDMIVAMVVLGLGLGTSMSLYTLIVQNALPTRIGQSTSTLTFFRQIGGTVALALMGSVMSSAYGPAFATALPDPVKQIIPTKILSVFNDPNVLLDSKVQQTVSQQLGAFGAQAQELFGQLMEAVKQGLTQGIHDVFLLSLGLIVIALVAVFFLKEIPLTGRQPTKNGTEGSEAEEQLSTPVMMH